MLGVMPRVLFVAGLVVAVIGLVLMASGLPIRDGTFDAEILTPGMTALVGGLILVGLSLAVRELRRIEQALVSRPFARVPRSVDSMTAATAADALEAVDAAVRPPLPSMPKAEPQLVPPVAAEAISADVAVAREVAAMREEVVPGRMPVFPPIPRRPERPPEERPEAPLSPHVAAPLEEEVAETASVVAAARVANGAAGSARVLPRLKARATPEKTNGSTPRVFWPVGPLRGGRAEPAAPVPPPAPAPPPVEEDVADITPAAPTVLKTGVVEGMAYTLYSDGSIDAALPQGTLRFGSISALRQHIESTS
jgi:hypothetical protein